MKPLLFGALSFGILSAVAANADDTPVKLPPPPPPVVYNWTGFYLGVNAGGAQGSFDPRTTTVPGTYISDAADIAAINRAGVLTLKPFGFVGGAQGGYNWQVGRFVLGLEADADYLNLNRNTNSGAVRYPVATGWWVTAPKYPLNQFVISSYADADWLFTLRPRVGVTANDWLFYATGGLAVTKLTGEFLFTDYNTVCACLGAASESDLSTFKAGYAVGGGVEAGLSNRLSVKAEYLFVDFGRTYAHEIANDWTTYPGPPYPSQTFNESMRLNASLVRLGLNYHFGVPDPATPSVSGWMPLKAPAWPAASVNSSPWEFDVGSRVWFSAGSIGAPDPLFDSPPLTLASRIVFSDLDAVSGETYARVDHNSGFFVKGFLGAGEVVHGKQNDEDFPFAVSYSNTLSSANGHIGYATIDLGYSFLRGPGAKVGAFVGYNYNEQDINTFNCTQIALDYACGTGNNFLGLAEHDHLNSLRVGLSSQYKLTDQLRFTADAAYVPWASFSGEDDHNWRELVLGEKSPRGDGVMLEASIDYYLTRNWYIGAGGRYWAWNFQTGTWTFNFLGAPPPFSEPARFNSERYGAFVQMGYQWGDTTPASGGATMPVKAPIVAAAGPMNWTGFYIGGHAGGGFSDGRWSDPFGSTTSIALSPPPANAVNLAGFGDVTHATGPLGGGQIGANLQTGHWVFGVQADVSKADLRGENTCFSGIGGINCQQVVNTIATVAGRAGLAWDRSLIYAKGGGAWTTTNYSLFANTNQVYSDTNPMTSGAGSTNVTASGWIAGAGIEYAITNNWTTAFEYDHIDVGRVGVAFPTVGVGFPTVVPLSAYNISVRQTLDVFKLAVNYKL